MEYIIKIGKNYIGCDGGKYTEVTNINQAIKGPMHKLNNLVKNCVAPEKRKKCKIILETDVNAVTIEHVTTALSLTTNDEQPLFDDVIAKLKTVGYMNFQKEHDVLSDRLSKIDQEIGDVYHYIEFNNLNAAEGYKAYKLLQEKLLKRRVIKNEFSKFQILSSAKVSDIFDGTLDKSLNDLANKTYTPRVLKELFIEGKDEH